MGKVLTKHIPQHENKAQPNHHPQDDCISPLSEVDLVHQVVDHWKFVCQVVQFGLNSLKRERMKGLRIKIQIKSSGVTASKTLKLCIKYVFTSCSSMLYTMQYAV